MIRALWLLCRNLAVNAARLLHRALHLRHRIDYVRLSVQGTLPPRRTRGRLPWLWRRFFHSPTEITFEELDGDLTRVERDPRVRGVIVCLGTLKMGWGRLCALRARLEALGSAGKDLAVYLQEAGNAEYYVASAARFIVLSPAGSLGLTGLSAEVRFYKDALQKLSTETEVVSAGKFKTAFEPFTRDEMSEAHREALGAILDDLFGELVEAVAQGRRMERETVRRLIDRGPYSPARAQEAGLVDAVAYEDEIESLLGETQVRLAAADEYRRVARRSCEWLPLWRPRQIAYLNLSGMIHLGESAQLPGRRVTCGHETICKALDVARRDGRFAAVVLHVDSRGGSALASDLIWREVSRLRAQKPVVAFLGDVAASGGYYAACAASHLVASKGTLTGSIGVLAGKLNLAGLLLRLGVRTEVIKRGASADLLSAARGFTTEERKRLEGDLQAFYRDFVSKVAQSRKLPVKRVEAAAEGRVWTGARALALGLVDELGTFSLAVRRARERAGIPEGAPAPLVSLGTEPARPALWGRGPWIPEAFLEAAADLAALEKLSGERVVCLCPWEIEVR
jgi:protease-4